MLFSRRFYIFYGFVLDYVFYVYCASFMLGFVSSAPAVRLAVKSISGITYFAASGT